MKNLNDSIAVKYIEANGHKAAEVAKKLWENPELSWNEVNAAKWNAEFLREAGFTVTEQYLGFPTAVYAAWGSGRPYIGLLAEYDALPGLSQTLSSKKEEAVMGGAGHGCGHNLMSGCCLAAAAAIKAEMEERGLPGTVVFCGCPAEENTSGKGFLAREGAFRELDAAFSWHAGAVNQATVGTENSLNSAEFRFRGRTAHAGNSPQDGRSALDAVELMNVGANYLREHVTDDARIHYVITNGGSAPNVVPEYASVWYMVRALNRRNLENIYARLCKVAQGAAMMTETEVEVVFAGGCYNTLENRRLAALLTETMRNLGAPEWSPEEIAFAKALNAASSNYEAMLSLGFDPEQPLSTVVGDPITENDAASTDVGDVQHITAGAQFNTAVAPFAVNLHSWMQTACAGHSLGMKGMLFGAKTMACAAIRLMEDAELLSAVRAEFTEAVKKEPYICPIPAWMKNPLPEQK